MMAGAIIVGRGRVGAARDLENAAVDVDAVGHAVYVARPKPVRAWSAYLVFNHRRVWCLVMGGSQERGRGWE